MNLPSQPAPATAPSGGRGKFTALSRPRRLSQCGRAVLLGCVGFYLLAQLAFDLVLLAWHPTMQDNCQSCKLHRLRELAAQEPDRPLLVMLGSSRTQHAFQAGLLDGLPGPGGKPLVAYNLGVPMAGHIHSWLYLRELLDAGIRPRLLLVEFSPLLLNEPRPGVVSEESWTLGPWLSGPHLVRCWPYFARPRAKAVEWLEARLAPWYVCRSDLGEWGREKAGRTTGPHAERMHDAWGFLRHGKLLARQEREFFVEANRQLYGPSLRDYRVGAGPTRAMRDLLETAHRERIPVVLVLMPESVAFSSWFRPEGLADALRRFAELRTTFRVETIDARRWLPDDDFNDGHHVTEAGARAFTTRLIEELRPILARIGAASPGKEPGSEITPAALSIPGDRLSFRPFDSRESTDP
jgi:hypothetical protein